MQGSWLDSISLKDLKTGASEVVFSELPLLRDAHLQYFYNPIAVIMNYMSKDMEGVVAPTDSRFRGDLRLYEEGFVEDADEVKLRIEEKQRALRKKIEENEMPPWKPMFFREVKHPFLKPEDQLGPLRDEDPV
jgi:hypothetical protein